MDLSRFNIDSQSDKIAFLKLQKHRLITLRWYYVGILTLVAVVSSLIAKLPYEVSWNYLVIGCVALAINGLLLFVNKKVPTKLRATQILMILQLILDLGLATYVTYDQGGINARTTILFALPIVAGGLLFTEGIVYLTAFLSGLGYILSVLLFAAHSNLMLEGSEILVPLIFYPAFFLILAQVVVYLMRIGGNTIREKAYDSFLALLSHQLKHPASTSNAIIDQLEHGLPTTPEKQKEYIQMLKVENQNLISLLNNLLITADLSPVNNANDIDLNLLLKRVTERSSQLHKRRQDLKLKIPNTPILVMGDSEKLFTALLNVLDNAFEYTKPGVPVNVDVRLHGHEVGLTISDSGPGIDKRARSRLFRKYEVQGDNVRGYHGLGLGLYVARKAVNACHGTLEVESYGKGTKVKVTLKRGKHE